MTVTIMSGFSPAGYHEYGKNFLETFDRFWPDEVQLNVFVEQPWPGPLHGAMAFGLFSRCPGQEEFLTRHKNNLEAQGRQPNKRWKDKERAAGYSFRFDACKFSRQCFIPEAAATMKEDGSVLAWLDADVVSYRPVPSGFVEDLLKDADVCYLGRGLKHSEIGFWACRLNPVVRAWLRDLAELFRSDRIFKLDEWHSAYAWDHTRKVHENRGLKTLNLTPNGSGHVWFQSPLGHYLDHLKGNRKQAGRSKERRA